MAAITMIYPLDLGTGPQNQNHMIFKARKIVGATGGGGQTNGGGLRPSFGGNLGEVILPIPTGLATGYSQGWDQTQVGFGAAMLAGNAGTEIKGMVEGGLIGGSAGVQKGFESLMDLLDKPMASLEQAIGLDTTPDNTAGAGLSPEATGFSMTRPGASDIISASQYTVGKRALDQTMISYSGPGFRSFNFNFSFKPLSQEETEVVNNIITFFKIQSAPMQSQTDFTRIYELPAVFKIRFYYGRTEHEHISKIGHCALTNIGITYGGDKFSTFDSRSHSPVQTDITLSFKEMELYNRQMLQEEYKSTGAGGQVGGFDIGPDGEFIPSIGNI